MAAAHQGLTDPQRTITEVEEQYEERKKAYRDAHAGWWQNVAFYLDRQWSRTDPYTGRIQPTVGTPPSGRVRDVHNLIKPRVRMYVAMTTSGRPVWRAQPATEDEDDRLAARAAGRAVECFARRTALALKLKTVTKWAALTGTGFLLPYYDPVRGGIEGLKLDTPSPFDIYPDDSCQNADDCNDIIRAHLFHVEQFKARFPNAKYVEPEEGFEIEAYTNRMIQEVQGSLSNGMPNKPKNRFVVLERWTRPCSKYPEGHWVVLSPREVLEEDAYPQEGFALLPLWYDIIPGRYFGQSMVGSLISPQKTYNRRVSQLAEIMNVHAHPKILIPAQSNIPVGTEAAKSVWTAASGEKIKYTAPYVPTVVPPPTVPGHVFRVIDMQIAVMDTIVNQPDAARGEQAPGVKSGRAMSHMYAVANRSLGETLESEAVALSNLGEWVLDEWRRNIPEPTAIQYLGEDGAIETSTFYASDIRSTSVLVMAEDLEPKDREVEKQDARNDLAAGTITKHQYLRIVGYGSSYEAEYNNRHRQRAREEWQLLKQGIPVNVLPHEDHEVHWDQHTIDMTSREFYASPPELQQISLDHLALHDARIQGGGSQQTPGGSGMPQQERKPPGPVGTAPTPAGEPGVNQAEETAQLQAMGIA